MAATVAARASTNGGSSTTSHSINLPSGISAGDLLIVAVSANGLSVSSISWPAGWTEIIEVSSNARVAVAKRTADGTEGSTITVTTDSSTVMGASALRITDASTVEVAGVDNGVNTVPNPPSLTPSGGSREYLWIAVGTLRSNIGSSRSITGAPTNYSNLNGDLIANSSGHVAVGTAERTLTASSENPGSFSVDSSSSVYAAGVTISIEPLEFRDASLTIALSTGMAVVANTITLRDAAIAIALSTTMAVSAQVATVVNAAVSIALTTTMAVQAGLLTFRDAAITIPVQITMAVAAGVATFVNAAISIALTTTMSVAARIRSFLIPKSRIFRITGVRHDPKRDRVTWDGEEV